MCPHPEAVGKRWFDPISEERQAELQGYLDRWAAEADKFKKASGPFGRGPEGVPLTGADVGWLAKQSQSRDDLILGRVPNLHLEGADLRRAHLENVDLQYAHLERANLREAHLERANLQYAHLEEVDLRRAHLKDAHLAESYFERANFQDAHLEGAWLSGAHLEHASLDAVHLEEAELGGAHLKGAALIGAHLERASLTESHLGGAALIGAHLEGAVLDKARLEGAELGGAWLDSKTVLSDVTLDSKTRLGDIQWTGVGTVNLTRINWAKVHRLGDEQSAGLRGGADQHEAVVRAYRQVAAQLRAQGMNEVADRFLYRAQVRQRGVLLRRFRIPQYLGSWLLDLISGYGYKPIRSFITYVLVILGFAAAYFALGGANGQMLSWNEAIVISMTAFHGRGFFSSIFQPGDLQAAVAAVEAFIGLLIEIVLIATFTQRFFAR
jgi:uncharacterized protein YjbI with pentapeptide repeats